MSQDPQVTAEAVATHGDLLFAAFYEGVAVSGYVTDLTFPERKFVVELLIDGWPAGLGRADRLDTRMAHRDDRWSDYGFAFDLQRIDLAQAGDIEVRIANTETTIAFFNVGEIVLSPQSKAGEVRWDGGLAFSGWISGDIGQPHRVRGIIDEDLVVESISNGLTLIECGDGNLPRASFSFSLSEQYRDGITRVIDVIGEDGRSLEGAPLTFCANASHLADKSSSDEHGSVPFDAVGEWSLQYFEEGLSAPQAAVAIVILGDSDLDTTLESLKDLNEEWILGVIPSPESSGCFDPHDLIEFLQTDALQCGAIVVATAGTRFHFDGPSRLALALESNPESTTAFGDILITTAGGEAPIAFAVYDDERFLEQGYAGWCFAVRPRDALSCAQRGAASCAALFLGCLDNASSPQAAPIHVPGFWATIPAIDTEAAGPVLAEAVERHIARRNGETKITLGKSTTLPVVHITRTITAEPISIVMPVRNAAADVRERVDNLLAMPLRHKIRLIIVDLNSSENALLRYFDFLKSTDVQVHRLKAGSNYATALNTGASLAHTRNILFLNPAVEVESAVIEELMSRCASPSIAAAGPVLCSPEGIVTSAGYVLHELYGARSAFRGMLKGQPAFGDMMLVAHQCSAASTDCLMVKLKDHEQVGGFDSSHLGTTFFPIDYGLKLMTNKRRMIICPSVTAIYHVKGSLEDRLRDDSLAGDAARRELRELQRRWRPLLQSDPNYSPLLSLDDVPFSSLASPPRHTAYRSA